MVQPDHDLAFTLPFHKMISGSILLLTVTGRKSRRAITVPVNYIRDGRTLWVASDRNRTWWRNLTGGAALTVTACPQDQTGAR